MTGQRTMEMSGTSWGTLGKIRIESGDPPKGLGLVGGPSARSVTHQGTLGEFRDGSGDPLGDLQRVGDPPGGLVRFGGPPGGKGQVEGPSGRSRTGWETLPEVREETKDPPGGLGQVWRPTGR